MVEIAQKLQQVIAYFKLEVGKAGFFKTNLEEGEIPSSKFIGSFLLLKTVELLFSN